MVFDPETFYNNPLSSVATAAITKIQHYYKSMLFLKYRKMSLKNTHFAMTIHRAYEQLTPFYNIFSEKA